MSLWLIQEWNISIIHKKTLCFSQEFEH